MAFTKISVSLEEETLAAARREAGRRACSRPRVRGLGRRFTQEEIHRSNEILDELGVRPAAW